MRFSRSLVRSLFSCSFVVGALSTSIEARAGAVADENQKVGTEDWLVDRDGSAAGEGVVDVYPARWSIARGDPIALKIRSTTDYAVRLFRLGWYGGAGATEIAFRPGFPADPQPLVGADPGFGIASAKWHDSFVLPTDASWTPGVYVARVEQTTGAQAETFFVVRDDGLAPRMPILFVIATATHAAYDAWPGASRGGKSLYDFNSSTTVPTESELTQAVKVSFDRPFLSFAGLADLPNYEVPYLRFLERSGWDVAYCTDQDLDADPSIALGRSVVTSAGHWEYWSAGMFDHALAARDAGTHFLFLTGDTLSWQIRFEDAASTVVGYKESYRRDPEEQTAIAARDSGDLPAARAHFSRVTRAWKSLEYEPDLGIDVRRPGIELTGVQSAGIVRDVSGAELDAFPWADLQIDAPAHWLFANTGLKGGDRIAGVMGYELDSAMSDDPTFDPFRPQGQLRLGTIVQDSDGQKKGSSAYYQAASGAEVVSLGAISFAWSLDDFAMKGAGYPGTSVDHRAQRMVTNALTRWTGAQPTHDPSGDEGDPGAPIDDPGAGSAAPAGPTSPDGAAVGPRKHAGCDFAGAGDGFDALLVGVGLFTTIAFGALRRKG